MVRPAKQFLLVEPIAKTPYPPLGLMKIASWLRRKHRACELHATVGESIPKGLSKPRAIYVTSLFTWDLDKVVRTILFFADRFPGVELNVGGIAASLLPDYIRTRTGIAPHVGLMKEAEECPPDYTLTFGRRLNASITFASRGCPNHCRFCCVATHEPKFVARDDWEKDVSQDFPRIIFWDNNWLASPRFSSDCEKIRILGKVVDFNQGLDARRYDRCVAKKLSSIKLDPIRFAFDGRASEKHVLRAIELAKKHSHCEVRVYVLYNFEDTPEDFYHRIDFLNRNGALAFPMEYRRPTAARRKFPGPNWNAALLRALKLSLIFYYRRGMITESRNSFVSMYGRNAKEFVTKLYDIFQYDKSLRR